jgi:hypothetical protein
MNFFQQMNQAPAPVFTDVEKDQLRPIVIEQYRNMTPEQQQNMTNQWHTRVTGYPGIRMSRKLSGDKISYNIVIRPQVADNYVGPFDVLFNTDNIPQQTRRGGKKSRRNRRPRKSRKSRRSRRTRRHK